MLWIEITRPQQLRTLRTHSVEPPGIEKCDRMHSIPVKLRFYSDHQETREPEINMFTRDRMKPALNTAFALAIIGAAIMTSAQPAAAAANPETKSMWEWVIEIFASDGGLGTTR